ncbi:MAG: translocation/assembly module TamB domain-containing protein [Steroidobacterales bacterium]
MRRALRISAWVLGSIAALLVLLAIAVLIAGNTRPGRDMIERLTDQLTGGNVRLTGLGGSFPADLTLERVELIDRGGVWLTAEHVALRWSPAALLEWHIQANSLKVARLDMERAPLPSPSSGPSKVSIPQIDIEQFSLDVVQLGAALTGRPVTLSARGGGRMVSLENARIDLEAHRIDPAGIGDYTLALRFDPARMDGTLIAHEPASGPLENILQAPGLGELSANLSIHGPRNAERVELELSAGELTAQVQGSVDMRNGAADLDFALAAPRVSPRPDLRWQRVALKGHWQGVFTAPTADGHLEVDRLDLPGNASISSLRADLSANGGVIALKGLIDGLRIPGPEPGLLQRDALKIEASIRPQEATRPLQVSITHRLFSLDAKAATAAPQSVVLDLRLPDLTPLAALGGQDVRGTATIKAQLDRRDADVGFSVSADSTLTGGEASWIAMVGNRVVLSLSGALSDAAATVDRLRLAGRGWTLAANAKASRPSAPGAAGPASAAAPSAIDKLVSSLDARWDLNVADLGIVSSALHGNLQASGRLSGAPTALSTDATVKSTLSIHGSAPGAVIAELHARGLPSAPSASVAAKGEVDGSPLLLAASLARMRRSGLRATVQRGEWKSARLAGEWAMQSSFAGSRGHAELHIGDLADLNHLLGTNVHGKLDVGANFTPQDGRTVAKFELDGENLAAGQLAGTVHVSGEGSTDSVAAQLNAKIPDLKGFPAELSADARVDLEHRAVHVLHAKMDYRGQQLHLLSAAKVSFGSALSIDELKLGVQDAVFEAHGEISPALDLHASLSHINPKLINAFQPELVLQGTIEGTANLHGSLSAPSGRISLSARGFRFQTDEALGLPALDLNAGAVLSGDSAALDIKLNAGSASLFSITGDTPFDAAGSYNLKVEGKLDIGVAAPFLEARGLHAAGTLAVNATVAGTLTEPQIRGDITLTNGSFRDYVRGVNLTNIGAAISGSQGTLEIKSFTASAATGSLSMTGSIGVLRAGIPVDLKLTATGAQLISSNILTANLNADIHVSGHALERLDVGGTILVNRAVIGISDSLPPDVAVLDVHRRGKAVQPAGKHAAIDLDIAIKAPREVLVQGRGLDAELGSDEGLHVGGTVSAPVVMGSLHLLRGTFTIGSSKLTFDNSSRVTFDGAGLKKNIDPTLDFTASATVQNVTATLHITGYADSPKIDLSSSSGQSQDEIMALLLFGQPAAQLTALQLAEVGAALATLSGGGGSNPLTRLQKSLGLDRLSVGSNTTTTATGATQSSGAAIQAGRYVTKHIYVEDKQSTSGQSQVEVDVDLTKHLKLQTRLGNGTAVQGTTPENDPGSSVGLSYQFEY